MKIVLCASEMVPFAKTGGLGDVLGALPLALDALGHEVVVTLPKYKNIPQGSLPEIAHLADATVLRLGERGRVYLIEHPSYFQREDLYGDKTGDYPDNLERFAYYCRSTLALLKRESFSPDIIHVHDWQAALIPVLLKAAAPADKFFKNTRVVLTIHNIGYQGIFPKGDYDSLGIDQRFFNPQMLEFFGSINLLKGGIVFSDAITTVSPTYAREIQTPELGFGLDGVLLHKRSALYGILNGLDYSLWNPATDKYIARNYSAASLDDKHVNKQHLQQVCGFTVSDKPLLCGIVSRLAQQKGFDLLRRVAGKLLLRDVQLVVLGSGDAVYEKFLGNLARQHPKKVCVRLGFDDPFAHAIYSGADLFLMPSHYEPCGLTQMISLAYGTLPLIYKTGGLADTVSEKNGFVFNVYSEGELLKAIKRAIDLFANPGAWRARMEEAMGCRFSWDVSVKEYIRVYEKIKTSSS